MNTPNLPISIDDTSWIAAKQAASLAHGELNALVTTLPYDQLSPSLDNAQSHLRHVQSERAKALNEKVREVSTDHLAQPVRLSGSAT